MPNVCKGLISQELDNFSQVSVCAKDILGLAGTCLSGDARARSPYSPGIKSQPGQGLGQDTRQKGKHRRAEGGDVSAQARREGSAGGASVTYLYLEHAYPALPATGHLRFPGSHLLTQGTCVNSKTLPMVAPLPRLVLDSSRTLRMGFGEHRNVLAMKPAGSRLRLTP